MRALVTNHEFPQKHYEYSLGSASPGTCCVCLPIKSQQHHILFGRLLRSGLAADKTSPLNPSPLNLTFLVQPPFLQRIPTTHPVVFPRLLFSKLHISQFSSRRSVVAAGIQSQRLQVHTFPKDIAKASQASPPTSLHTFSLYRHT